MRSTRGYSEVRGALCSVHGEEKYYLPSLSVDRGEWRVRYVFIALQQVFDNGRRMSEWLPFELSAICLFDQTYNVTSRPIIIRESRLLCRQCDGW